MQSIHIKHLSGKQKFHYQLFPALFEAFAFLNWFYRRKIGVIKFECKFSFRGNLMMPTKHSQTMFIVPKDVHKKGEGTRRMRSSLNLIISELVNNLARVFCSPFLS